MGEQMYKMSNEEALKLWPPYKRMIGWIDSFRITHPNGLTLDEMHKAVAGYINTHYVHVEEHERVVATATETARMEERERAAKIADNPYSDTVQASGSDEPMAVATKIALAIRAEGGKGEEAP